MISLSLVIIDLLLDEAPLACLHIWTSGQTLEDGPEFCSILNFILRNDREELVRAAMPLIRCINSLCAMTRKGGVQIVKWPVDNKLYRGTGMPMEFVLVFKKDVKY